MSIVWLFKILGGNVNRCRHYGEQYGDSSKKLKIELPYDPAIPLLSIYPEKTIIRKDAYTPMIIAARFTIAKTWKQPIELIDQFGEGGHSVWRFLKKLKIELPYDLAIPLLGIYPEKTIIQKTHITQCLLQHYLQ